MGEMTLSPISRRIKPPTERDTDDTEIFPSPSLQVFSGAINHGRPELGKKLSSLHAQFSAIPKNLSSSSKNNNNNNNSEDKMEGVAARLARGHREWLGGLPSSVGGLCGCIRDNDEPPEITYCVVDGAGTLNLQAVAPAIPMPADEEELNKKFSELVVSFLLCFFYGRYLQPDGLMMRAPDNLGRGYVSVSIGRARALSSAIT